MQDTKQCAGQRKKGQKASREQDVLVNFLALPLRQKPHPLEGMHCIERNLVYVTGLPLGVNACCLKSRHQFGRFGPIKSVQISGPKNKDSQCSTLAVHLEFRTPINAAACLYGCLNNTYNGFPLEASYGTNKYCKNFLRKGKCFVANCTFKHSYADPRDQFTAKEAKEKSPAFLNATRPCPPDGFKFVMCDIFLNRLQEPVPIPKPISVSSVDFQTEEDPFVVALIAEINDKYFASYVNDYEGEDTMVLTSDCFSLQSPPRPLSSGFDYFNQREHFIQYQ